MSTNKRSHANISSDEESSKESSHEEWSWGSSREETPDADSDSDEVFVVEKILKKCVRGKKVSYFVKWKGYGEKDNTWETGGRMRKNHPDAVKKFEEDLEKGLEEENLSVEYVVKKILDKRTVNGKTEYLVKWKKFGDQWDSWEPSDYLNDCRELVEKFERKLLKANGEGGKKKKKKKRRSRRYRASRESSEQGDDDAEMGVDIDCNDAKTKMREKRTKMKRTRRVSSELGGSDAEFDTYDTNAMEEEKKKNASSSRRESSESEDNDSGMDACNAKEKMKKKRSSSESSDPGSDKAVVNFTAAIAKKSPRNQSSMASLKHVEERSVKIVGAISYKKERKFYVKVKNRHDVDLIHADELKSLFPTLVAKFYDSSFWSLFEEH